MRKKFVIQGDLPNYRNHTNILSIEYVAKGPAPIGGYYL